MRLVLFVVGTRPNMYLDWAEDVHGIFAWKPLAMIVLHLLGLVLHSVRFRENIALSMVTGRKRVAGCRSGVEVATARIRVGGSGGKCVFYRTAAGQL